MEETDEVVGGGVLPVGGGDGIVEARPGEWIGWRGF
jgi:hypothetical protein